MEKRKTKFVCLLAALIAVLILDGCDINNPVIDEWWVGETPEPRIIVPVTRFTVTFDMQGGSYVDLRPVTDSNYVPPDGPIPPQIVLAGKATVYEPGLVENPAKPYFAGWYTAPGSGGIRWDFNTTPATAEYDPDGDGIIPLYAGWSDSGYTVTFEPGGDFDKNGSIDPVNEIDFSDTTYAPKPEYVAQGVELSQPKSFGLKPDNSSADKDGKYAFTGWYLDKDGDKIVGAGDEKWDFTKPVESGMTLYAGWGTRVSIGTVIPPENVVTTEEPPIPLYKVKFEDNDESPNTFILPEEVLDGEKVPSPGAIYKAGNTFTGWYTDKNCTQKWDFTEFVEGDMTLYAGWKENPPEIKDPEVYNVTFDMQGGRYVDLRLTTDPNYIPPEGPIPTQTVAPGSATVHEPGLVENPAHRFLGGWYTAPGSGGIRWDFDTTPATADYDPDKNGIITLYAGWSDSGYTVTFRPGGDVSKKDGIIDPVNEIDFSKTSYAPLPEYVAPNTELSQPKGFGLKSTDPLASEYVFTGWYIDEDDNGVVGVGDTKWDFTETVKNDMTLYAGWGKLAGDIEQPPEVVPPEVPPEEPRVPVYEVTFEDNDDNPDTFILPEDVLDGEKVPSPGAIYKAGNTFTGWYTDKNCTQKWDFSTETVEDDMTLYAGWKENPPEVKDPEVYNVTFDMQGGSYVDLRDPPLVPPEGPIPAQTVTAGSTAVQEPGLVENPAHRFFGGWYTAPGSGGIPWDFDTTPATPDYDPDKNGIITLYAGWSDSGYTVTFEPGGDFDRSGSIDPVNEIDFSKTSYAPLPEYVARGVELSQPNGFGLKSDDSLASKYAFTGWYTDVNGNGVVDKGDTKWDFTKPVESDMTLYAGWGTKTAPGVTPPGVYQPELGGTPVPTYTVTFDSDGAKTTPDPEEVLSGNKLPAPDAIHRDGYIFSGWYKSSARKNEWDFSTETVDETDDTFSGADDNKFTLYAKWEPEPYTQPWLDDNYIQGNPKDSSGNSIGKLYFPFQCDPGYYDLGDNDHVGGEDNYNTNVDYQMTIIEYLKKNPTWVAVIEGYADVDTAPGDSAKLIADREVTTWWLLRTETGVRENQLIVRSKLPAGYDDPPDSMIIGPNDPKGAVGADGDEIKVYLYIPLN